MKKLCSRERLAAACSTVYLLGAVLLLLISLHVCCPELENALKSAVAGWDAGPVRSAFHTLADGLEAGMPMKAVFSETAEILFSK